jgi:hypothetical protein
MVDAPEGPRTVTCEFDWNAGIIYLTLRGDVRFEDLCAAQDEVLMHPRYSPGMPIYMDCRVVSSIPSQEEIRKLALSRIVRAQSMPVGRLAIVAMTQLGFTFASGFELFLDDQKNEVGIFTTAEAARTWLGSPPRA